MREHRSIGVKPASGCASDSGVHAAAHSISVPLYRYYFLDHRRYVVDHRIVTCETDEDARTLAGALLRENVYPAIEVWEGERQVWEAKKA